MPSHDLDPLFDAARNQLVDRVAADPQMFLDPLLNVVAAGEDRVEPKTRKGAQLVESLEVKRVIDGNFDFAIRAADGQNGVAKDGRRGKLRQQSAVDLDRLQIDEFEAQSVGKRLERVFLVDGALLDEHLVNAAPCRLTDGRIELVARDESAF
jgi:hypothetical protein